MPARTEGSDIMTAEICRFDNVTVSYAPKTSGILPAKGPRRHALKSVSFDMPHGQRLGIVGESGSGKSTLLRGLCALTHTDEGEIIFQGQPLNSRDINAHAQLGGKVQMVFQDPISSLSPRRSARQIVEEPLIAQKNPDFRPLAEDMLQQVGISNELRDHYPHQVSLGQCQRIGIARALATKPDLLLCDEPVAALDRSMQTQIIQLIDRLQRRLGFSLILVSHDFRVIERLCERVLVLNQGRVVEDGLVDRIMKEPAHPYTQALIDAMPRSDPAWPDKKRLPLEGPKLLNGTREAMCPYAPRCAKAMQLCVDVVPPVRRADNHAVACHFA